MKCNQNILNLKILIFYGQDNLYGVGLDQVRSSPKSYHWIHNKDHPCGAKKKKKRCVVANASNSLEINSFDVFYGWNVYNGWDMMEWYGYGNGHQGGPSGCHQHHRVVQRGRVGCNFL